LAQRAPRRQRQPEVSRSGILDAALACFSERGYHQTSIDAIAERAGLSKGAIYWHFAGKRDLFLALVDRAQEAAEPMARAVAEAPDWRAALAVLFAHAPERIANDLPLLRISLEFISHGPSDEGIRERAERKIDRWAQVLGEQLERGIAAGELQPIAARVLLLVIGGTISGLTLAKLSQADVDLAPVWRAAEEIFARGIRK
jgi:AcrR family transcriptional regulator